VIGDADGQQRERGAAVSLTLLKKLID